MRITSQTDHFFYGIGVTHRVFLRQHADSARQFRSAERANIPARQRNFSRVWHPPGNRLDQGGFARAVWADQHQPFSLFQLKGQILHHGARAIANRYVFGFQHAAHPAFLAR